VSVLDAEILRGADVTQADAANALRLTRQRISQLVRSEDDFLTPVRAQRIFMYLKDKQHPGAETFDRLAKQRIPGAKDEPRPAYVRGYLDSIILPGNPRPWVNAEELWVFSAKPKEVYQAPYLKSMEERFFAISPSIKLRTIVYFVPPDVATQLCRDLHHSFIKIEPANRANVTVVASPAAIICPRFVIFDPRSLDPIGLIVIDEDDNTYARLPRLQVTETLDGLKRAGFGVRVDELYVPPLPDAPDQANSPQFKIRFCSRGDPMVVRG